jgi:hypothetical protein
MYTGAIILQLSLRNYSGAFGVWIDRAGAVIDLFELPLIMCEELKALGASYLVYLLYLSQALTTYPFQVRKSMMRVFIRPRPNVARETC